MNIDRSAWYNDETDLVIRWVSNDSIPPEDCIEWLYTNNFIGRGWYVKSNHLREVETMISIENYRKHMENYVHSDEELFEMRCAFGAEARIVNAITGKVTIL